MSEKVPEKLIYGFHAVLARLRHDPAGVLEIYLDLTRRDARARDLVHQAKDAGVKLAQVEADRLERLVGKAARHQGVVARVLHPALNGCPGHAIWQRDFSGASGLFSIVLEPVSEAAVNAFLDELSLFGMGASWGGFESLAIPFDCAGIRTATAWAPGGPTLRLHVGLEDVDDLIGDLERGFAALAAARQR